VLAQQAGHFARGRRIVFFDQAKLESATRRIYRVIMPILFAVVGALLAISTFGTE
jgi:hypothetical protein